MKKIDKRISAFIIVLIMVFCFPQSIIKNYLGIGIQVSAADGRLYDQRSTKWVNVIHGTGHLSGPGVYDSGYSTGCGIFSFCNAIYALNDIKLDPVSVADWAHSIGAYNKNGAEGTYREVFYNNVQSKYGQDLKISMDGFFSIANINDSRLTNHLNSGGVAIGYVPGHFIAITGYDNTSSKFKVIDSFVINSRNLPACGWVSSSALNGTNSQSKVSWVALLSKHYENVDPTYAKLSVQDNRTEFTTGEEVNFKMESDGTAHYTIGIDRDGQRILTTDVGTYNSEYNYTLTEPGSYSVYVSNYYMDGTNHVESNVVKFNVLPRLLAPNVSVQVNGKNVRLSWDPVQFATHYDVRVYYEDGTHYEDYWGGIPAETYIDLELPINQKFYAQVCSSNVDYGNFTYCTPVYFETGVNCPSLKAPDVNVNINGRNVRLSWDAVENATHYDVRIYYADGTSYEDYWGGIPAETYKDLVLPADTKFYAIVCSANVDYGNFTYCNPIYFETGHDVPTWAKVSISNNKSEFYVGDKITFKMEADVADNFCIAIFDGEERFETVFLEKGISEYTYKATKAGTYSAYISASVNNGLEYVDSKRISFTVKEKIVPTVSVPGTYTYKGTSITPTLIVKVGNVTLTKGIDYTVTATNNKNAGIANYTVKALSGSNYSFTDVNGTFTIAKKTLTVSAGTYKVSKVFDGTASAGKASGALSVSGVVSGETITVKTGTIPAYSSANVGTSTISIPISISNSNYKLSSSSVSVPAEIIANSSVPSTETGTYVYSGKAIVPYVVVRLNGRILSEGTDYTVTATNNINAGTANYTVKAVSGSNYSFSDVKGTFTIEKKRITVSAGTYEITKKYDGTTSPGKGSGTLSVSGVVSGDTVTVTPGTIPSYSDARVHYESVLLPVSITNSNYVLSSPTVSVYAYITAVAPTVTVLGTYTYTGKAIIPNVTVTLIGKKLVKGTDYTITATNNVNAGTATYTIKSVTGSDYAFADVTGTFTINKAKASVAAMPTAIYGLKYDGKAKALVTAGTGQNGTMVYSLDGKTYSSNTPTAIQAGTYTVYYKVQGSGNYTDSAVYQLTVEIANGEEKIKSISVSNNNILVIYGYVGSDESSRSERVAFADVTIDMVEWMYQNDKSCSLLADYVNAFTALSSSDNVILTEAQVKAIEYVLAYDYSNA